MLKVKEFCLDSFTNLAFFVMFWNKSELSGWPSQPYFLSSKEVKQFHGKQKEPCICTGLHWFPIWRLSLIGDFWFAVQMWKYFQLSATWTLLNHVNSVERFLNQKKFFFVLYSYIGMMYSYFLVCMSLSNLPTCVVHQIFTTITQSICPYRILLLSTTACTDGQASRVYFVGDLIILRFPWLRVIIFRLRAVIVFSIVVIVFVL